MLTLHIRVVSPQSLLLALKKIDVDEGSGPSRVWRETAILELYWFVSPSLTCTVVGSKMSDSQTV